MFTMPWQSRTNTAGELLLSTYSIDKKPRILLETGEKSPVSRQKYGFSDGANEKDAPYSKRLLRIVSLGHKLSTIIIGKLWV